MSFCLLVVCCLDTALLLWVMRHYVWMKTVQMSTVISAEGARLISRSVVPKKKAHLLREKKYGCVSYENAVVFLSYGIDV